MSNPVLPNIPIDAIIQHRRFIQAPSIDWREFTVFPKLPPELRLKIWACALPDPRVITIESVPPRPKDYLISCQDRVPSSLLVNRESRNVALKRYSLHFLTFENVYGPPVYFDLARDIVCVKRCSNNWWADFNDGFNKDLSLVKRIIIINPVGRLLIERIPLTTPFCNMEILGLVRQACDTELPWNEQVQIIFNLRAQMTAAKAESEELGGTVAKVLEALQFYFLSWADVVNLELGKSLWEF